MMERHFPEVASMISIVDDDPLVRDATVDLLSSLGYPALAFETAEEFLNSGQVETTLCLITDQQLPGLDGLGLQNQLIADGSHVPVIFITAFPDDQCSRTRDEGRSHRVLGQAFRRSRFSAGDPDRGGTAVGQSAPNKRQSLPKASPQAMSLHHHAMARQKLKVVVCIARH